MKVLKVKIENYKLLEEIELDLSGRSIIVTGPNEVGKSSLIDSIFDVLSNGDMPPKPIRDGEDNGLIQIEVGDEESGTKYIVQKSFTRANEKGYLTISTPDGAKYSKPVEHLHKLFGTISFDIEKLLNAKNEKEMFKMLKDFLNIDTVDLDAEYKKIFEERAFLNKEVSTLQQFIKEFAPGYIENKTEELAKLKLKAQELEPKKLELAKVQSSIIKGNDFINNNAEIIQNINISINSNNATVQRNQELIADYEKKIIELKEANNKITKENLVHAENLKKETKIKEDATLLLKKYNEEKDQLVADTNTESDASLMIAIEKDIQEYNTSIETAKTVETKSTEAKAKTKKLDEIKAKISDLFKAASTDEITITEDEILYKGLPLNKKQINTASLARLALQLAMKSNSKLQSVRFDASFMDNKTFHETMNEIRKAGFQAFVEMVDKEGQDLQIVVEEDIL